MNYFLSIFTGVVISVMIAFNGMLNNSLGLYHTAVVIHIFGLSLLIILLLIKKENIVIKENLPFYYFIGGFLGVATTLFNNFSFSYLGVSLMLALGLFGQTVTSIILDKIGMFNKKSKIGLNSYIGLILIILGLTIMIH